MYHVGIDLGGTKIEGVIIDPERISEPVARLRCATGADRGYDHILGQIAGLVEELRGACPDEFPNVIGMGTPGTVDPKTKLMRGSNTQCLNGRPLKADIESRTGLSFAVANDANCFALAEATLGVARGYETVFGIIMGTGCGGGFVVNGKVLSGCHGIAGEWGQMIVEPGGVESGYGTRGTVETYLAGPALEKFYAQQSGEKLSLKEIVARVGHDAAAAETIERLKTYFARSLAFIIDTFDPHAIVVGGGVGNLEVLYTQEMRDRISEVIFTPTFEAALLKPQLGDSAGVFGAAMLTI